MTRQALNNNNNNNSCFSKASTLRALSVYASSSPESAMVMVPDVLPLELPLPSMALTMSKPSTTLPNTT